MDDYRLTNLDTNEAQTFSNRPGGLRPLRLLEVPYIPVAQVPGQSFNRTCAAACGLALLKACKKNDPATLESLLGEMEAAPGGLTSEKLQAALHNHGVPTRWESGLESFDLFTRLQAQKPLIVLLDFSMLVAEGLPVALETEETRFVLLIGMDNGQVCLHDPAAPAGAGESLCLPLESFEHALRSAVTGGGGLFEGLAPLYGLNDPFYGSAPLFWVRTLAGINIRSGPAKSYTDIGDVMAGVEKAIFEESFEKSFGRIAPGQWITLDPQWVRRLTGEASGQPSGASPAAEVLPAGLPYRVKVIRPIYIRSGPGKTFQAIGGLAVNAVRTILAENADQSYGQVAPGMWITLSPVYVKKL